MVDGLPPAISFGVRRNFPISIWAVFKRCGSILARILFLDSLCNIILACWSAGCQWGYPVFAFGRLVKMLLFCSLRSLDCVGYYFVVSIVVLLYVVCFLRRVPKYEGEPRDNEDL